MGVEGVTQFAQQVGMYTVCVGIYSTTTSHCFSAILASRILKEKLNLLGKVGCMLCVLGSTVMVIHSPKEQEVANIDQLKAMVAEPGVYLAAHE